ncbi:MAG: hypothetical protein IH994_04105 [Proteobacteria bacterium]|nr:hypothetical protein [Pseudomonadota bacterium]
MGRKFDANLPDMTDKELYAVDETSLDVQSLRALHHEIAYRESLKEEENAPDNAPENGDKGREAWRAEWMRWAVGLAVTIGLALAFGSWGTD